MYNSITPSCILQQVSTEKEADADKYVREHSFHREDGACPTLEMRTQTSFAVKQRQRGRSSELEQEYEYAIRKHVVQ